MDNQEFSDADLGLTPVVKPENKNVVTPDEVAPAVKRRDWNNLSDDDLFAPEKPSMFKPESAFKDMSPVITSGLGHGQAVVMTADGRSKQLVYWNKNKMTFDSKKPIDKYLRPPSGPGDIGDLPNAMTTTQIQAAKKEYEDNLKALNEQKTKYAQYEADLAKTPGAARYVGNYGVDLRESIKELEEKVRATKNESFNPEDILGVQIGDGNAVTLAQNFARGTAHTLGTLPGFTTTAPIGARLGMKVPGPPIVKAASAAIGGAITGTLGGMATGGIEQYLENLVLPMSEQEIANTLTAPGAATTGQTLSLLGPFNLQKLSTVGKAVGINAPTSAIRNAARIEIAKNAAGMVPIGAAGRGAAAIQAELGQKRDQDGNLVEQTGFSVGNVAKEIFSPSGIGHDLLTGAAIRGANKVGRKFEFHRAGAWLASKLPAGSMSAEQKAMFEEATQAQAAQAAEQGKAETEQPKAGETQAQAAKERPPGSVEPLPEFPPESASDAEKQAWLGAAQAWHEKYGATHSYDGTPMAGSDLAQQPRAEQPVVAPQQQAAETTGPAPRKLTPKEQEAEDLKDFDPNSVNPEIPSVPKRPGSYGDESIPGYRPEFDQPENRGAASDVPPIAPMPRLPESFFEGIPSIHHNGGYTNLLIDAAKDPRIPENVRNLIQQRIDANRVNFDLVDQDQSKWMRSKSDAEKAIQSQPGKEKVRYNTQGQAIDVSKFDFSSENRELIVKAQKEWDAKYGEDFHHTGQMRATKSYEKKEKAIEEARKKHLESKALEREVAAERSKNEAEAKKQAEAKAKQEAKKKDAEEAPPQSRNRDIEEKLSPEDNAWINKPRPGATGILGMGAGAIRDFIRRPFTDQQNMNLEKTKAFLERNQQAKDSKGPDGDIYRLHELRVKYHSGETQGAKPTKPVKPEPVEPVDPVESDVIPEGRENAIKWFAHFSGLSIKELRIQKQIKEGWLKSSQYTKKEKDQFRQDIENIDRAIELKSKEKNQESEEDVEPKETDAQLVRRRDSLIEDAKEFRENEDDASFKEFMDKAREINDRIKDPKKKIKIETDADLNEKEDEIATENPIEAPEPTKDEDIRTEAIDGARKAIKEWELQREKLKKLNDRKPSDKTERQINNLTQKIKENEAAVTGLVAAERARRAKLDPLKDKVDLLEQNKANAQAKQDLTRLSELEGSNAFKSGKITSIKNYSAVLGKSISDLYDVTKKSMDKSKKDALEAILKIVNLIHDFEKYEDLKDVEDPAKKSILRASKAYADILAGKDPALRIYTLQQTFRHLKTLYWKSGDGESKAVIEARKFFDVETPVEPKPQEIPKTEIETEAAYDVEQREKHEIAVKRRNEFQKMSYGEWETFRSRNIERIKELTKLLKQLYGRKQQTPDVLQKISQAHAQVHTIVHSIVTTGIFDPSIKFDKNVKRFGEDSIHDELFDAVMDYESVPPHTGHEVVLQKRIEIYNKSFAKRNAELGAAAQPDKAPEVEYTKPKKLPKESTVIVEKGTGRYTVTKQQKDIMGLTFAIKKPDAYELAKQYRDRESGIRSFIDLVDAVYRQNQSTPDHHPVVAGEALYDTIYRIDGESRSASDHKAFFEGALASFKETRLRTHIKDAAQFKKTIEKALEIASEKASQAPKQKNVKPKKDVEQPKGGEDGVEKVIKTILSLEQFTNEAQNYEVVQKRESMGTDGKWYSNGNFPAGVRDAKKIPRNAGWVLRHKVAQTTHGVVHATKGGALEALKSYQEKASKDFEEELRKMDDEKLKSQLKFWLKEAEKYGKQNKKEKELADLVAQLDANLSSSEQAEAPKAPEARNEPEDSIQERQKDLEAKKKKAEDDAIAAAAKDNKDTRVDPTDGITYVRDGDQEIPIAVTIDKNQKSMKGVQKVVKAGVDLDGTDPYQEIMPPGAKYFTNGKLIYIEAESALDRTPLRKNQQRKIEDPEQANKMGDGVIKIKGQRWIDVTLPDEPQSLTFEVLESPGKRGRDSDGVIRISTAWSTARNGVNAQAFYAPDLLRQLIKNMDKDTTLRLVYTDYGNAEPVVMAVAVKKGKIVGLAMPLNPKVGAMGTLYNPKAVKARRGGAEEPETEAMASEDAMRAAQQGREQQKSAQGDLFGVEGENYNRRVKPGVLIGEDGLPIRPGAGRRGQGELSFAQIAGKEYTEGGFPQWFEVGHNEVEYTVGRKFRDIEPESVTIPGGKGYRPDTFLEPGDTFSPREDMFAFGVDGSFRKTQADKYTPDHEEWLSGESETQTADWIPAEFSWYGRVNHPVYDTKGNVVIRGAISVSLNPEAVVKSNKGSEAGVEIQTKDGRVRVRNKLPPEMVQRLKEEVSRQGQADPDSTDSPTSLLHLDRPEHYDIFVFNESASARRDRGISSEDASPTQLMPAGTYNPGKNHMKPNHSDQELAKRGFISNFADKNIPANLRDRLTLDISEVLPKWSTKKEGSASYEGALMIDVGYGNKRKIGEFYYNVNDEHGTLDWIKINYAFRGRKLSEVVGAELLERMRRDQATSVSAMVVDPLVRPIKMLERLLGVKNKTAHSETFEQTDANDKFGFPDQDYPGEYLKAVNDVEFNIDPKTELTTSGHKNRTGRPELDKFYDTGSTPETEKAALERIEASLDKPMDIINAVDMVLKDLPETPRSLLLQQLSRVAKSKGLQISFRSTGSRGSYAMGEKPGLGGYTDKGETIRIWMPDVQAEVSKRGYKMMDTIIYVMSHEISHHHTLQLIKDNVKITGFGENSIGFRDRVRQLMDHVIAQGAFDDTPGSMEYGLTKESEFMAEVLTNPKFRDILSKMPAPPDSNVRVGKPQSVLEQIFFSIKMAFRKIGINMDKGTVFDRATELYAESLETPNRPMDRAEMDAGREGAFGPGFDKTYRWNPRAEAPQTLEQSNAELDANQANIDKLNSKNPKDVQEGIDSIIPDSELMPPSGGGGGGGGPAPASAAGSAPRAGKTKGQKAWDFATLRALSGISVKAHQNARRYPNSAAVRAIANFIHARPGSQSRAFQRDIPTAISRARQKYQNKFVDIMTPIRSMLDGFKDAPNGGPTAAEQRELVYRTIHDMVTGDVPISKGKIGEVASKLKDLLSEMHDYRTLAGEKIGEVADFYPARYDSDRIAQGEQGFIADARNAYEMTIRDIAKGPFYDNVKKKKKAAEYQAEAWAEQAKMLGIGVKEMLAMPKHEFDNAVKAKAKELAEVLFRQHQRGMSQEEFSSIFGSGSIVSGSENSSLSRVFKGDAQRVMRKWQHADPFRVVTSYIASATKRAEMVRKFGDDGKIWENYSSKMERDGVPRQVIREMRSLMRKAAGVGIPPRAEGEQIYVDSLALITAAAALGKSALNNLVEPGTMGMRSNSLRRMAEGYIKTWTHSARNILRLSKTLDNKLGPTFWEAYGNHIGTIHKTIDDAWTMGHTTDVNLDTTGSTLRWLTSRVYESNLMDATERAKQTASLSVARNYIRDLALLTKKQHWMNKAGMDPAQSTADNLSELGIQPGLQKKFADWMLTLEGLDDKQLMDKITKGDQMSRLFEEAMVRFAQQTSVTSARQHKPEFQDSTGGATVLTLMNFSYSFAAEVNSRVYDHIKQSVARAPKGKTYGPSDRASMLMAPIVMGAVSTALYYALFELKQLVYPTDQSGAMLGKNPYAKALNAFSYAGFLGPKFEYLMKFVQRDQLPGGPTVKMASNIARAGASAAELPFSDKSPGAVQKSLVKAAIPVVRGGIVAGASAANPVVGALAVQGTNITQPQNELLESFENEKKGIGDFLQAQPPGGKQGGGGGMSAKPPGKKK